MSDESAFVHPSVGTSYHRFLTSADPSKKADGELREKMRLRELTERTQSGYPLGSFGSLLEGQSLSENLYLHDMVISLFPHARTKVHGDCNYRT